MKKKKKKVSGTFFGVVGAEQGALRKRFLTPFLSHLFFPVSVDFDADPNQLAKQSAEEFQAIKPVAPFYESYKIETPFLLKTRRQTRRAKMEPIKGQDAPPNKKE